MADIVITESITYGDTADWDLANRVRVTAHATESIGGSRYTATVADAAAASETITLGVLVVDGSGLGDTVAAADAVTVIGVSTAQDSAAAAETVSGTGHTSITVTDSAEATESVTPLQTAVVSDSAAASDAASGALVLPVSDSAAASETAAGARTASVTVAERAGASDAQSAPGTQALVDSAAASEAIIDLRRHTDAASDSAAAGETVSAGAKIAIEIEDSAAASETVSGVATVTATVEATAEAEDYVRLPATSVPDFWCNVATGAAATWDGLPFNSFIEADGTVYAAGVDGLYSLATGVNDDGDDVNAEVLYDLTNFGSAQRKRLDSIYLEASNAGKFTVTLASQAGSYSYVARRPGNLLAHHRAQPGQGLRDVHYRIGVRASDDFAVNAVRVAYADLGRRI